MPAAMIREFCRPFGAWGQGGAVFRGLRPRLAIVRPLRGCGGSQPPRGDWCVAVGETHGSPPACVGTRAHSGALGRRCLQQVLREKAGVGSGDLCKEIDQALDARQLPTQLAENLDAVRHIGSFAAHLNRSLSAGQIVQVGPNEAERNLDVLEGLFDLYFVQPAAAQQKRDALNARPAEMGKGPLKSPAPGLTSTAAWPSRTARQVATPGKVVFPLLPSRATMRRTRGPAGAYPLATVAGCWCLSYRGPRAQSGLRDLCRWLRSLWTGRNACPPRTLGWLGVHDDVGQTYAARRVRSRGDCREVAGPVGGRPAA
ncbi:MAG: DUF4145 domain-containing protein [Armatimonadetes bacterium]|nr:DUF4145 domain-containing protein [Armatimonadota bacterium]